MTGACGERHFSAGEKVLKQRMKSVKNIGKVTKAMKMISATKMKKDLARHENGRHFGLDAVDMISKSDQFLQKKIPADVAEPSCLVVPITSDKGLCGAVNSAIVREVKKMLIGVNRSKY
jgi:F-type H+-transporting ATPase subunit gamma